jgi:hypothetical protein
MQNKRLRALNRTQRTGAKSIALHACSRAIYLTYTPLAGVDVAGIAIYGAFPSAFDSAWESTCWSCAEAQDPE